MPPPGRPDAGGPPAGGPPAGEAREPETTRILVVDDEPGIRKLLARWLAEEGYPCDTAGSGREALELLERDGYSLLLSDIRMPGPSGVELLSLVQERYPGVAVIMVTAVDERDTAIRMLRLGAYGYVIKPFDRNEILITVADALERRRLVQLREEYTRRLEEEVRARTAQIRSREEEITLRLLWAAEYRDDETGAHIRRIGLYCEALARALGWKVEEIDRLRLAAPMHDIGKIGVPDRVLLKPGKLMPEEFEIMKRHTLIGARILEGSEVPMLKLAREIALTHHERWDGSGYPRGLEGEAIPIHGRMVAVADVYDALTHDRVYRPAFPEEEALEIMRRGRGRYFDPKLLDCFLEVLPEFRAIRERVGADEAAPGSGRPRPSAR